MRNMRHWYCIDIFFVVFCQFCEVTDMLGCLQSNYVATQQAVENFQEPRTHTHLVRMRPGYVPKTDNCGVR